MDKTYQVKMGGRNQGKMVAVIEAVKQRIDYLQDSLTFKEDDLTYYNGEIKSLEKYLTKTIENRNTLLDFVETYKGVTYDYVINIIEEKVKTLEQITIDVKSKIKFKKEEVKNIHHHGKDLLIEIESLKEFLKNMRYVKTQI